MCARRRGEREERDVMTGRTMFAVEIEGGRERRWTNEWSDAKIEALEGRMPRPDRRSKR